MLVMVFVVAVEYVTEAEYSSEDDLDDVNP